MTSKTRAALKALAVKEDAIYQIGKSQITDNLIEGLSQALDKRELIKVSVLKGCDLPCEELLRMLAEKLNAQPVAAVGNKLILYRVSSVKGARHIEL